MYDVTFHPIKENELKDLILKPTQDPSLRSAAIEKITQDIDGRKHLGDVFHELESLVGEAEKDQTWHYFLSGCAMVAGYLHPYWWGKNTALKYLPEFQVEFSPLIKGIETVDSAFFAGVKETHPPVLDDSYSGGGFISSSMIHEFRSKFSRLVAEGEFNVLPWANLVFALEYAEKNNCAIIETSGVYDTAAGCSTNPNNLYTSINMPAGLGVSVPGDTPDPQALMSQWVKEGPEAYTAFVQSHLVV